MIMMMMMILDLMRITCTSVSIIYYLYQSIIINHYCSGEDLGDGEHFRSNMPKQSPHDVLGPRTLFSIMKREYLPRSLIFARIFH